MSNLVEQINDSIKSIVATELGAEYSELDFVLDVSQNSFDRSALRYGVRPLFAGTSAVAITKNYRLDHDFEIILTNEFVNTGVDDVDAREKTFVLYDKMDEIFRILYFKKAGLPSIVVNMNNINMQEPEYLEDKVVVLRASMTIIYGAQLE